MHIYCVHFYYKISLMENIDYHYLKNLYIYKYIKESSCNYCEKLFLLSHWLIIQNILYILKSKRVSKRIKIILTLKNDISYINNF